MNKRADQLAMSKLTVRQGESLKLKRDKHTLHEVWCDDIARLALAIDERRYFFERCRGLRIYFSPDINGSGQQLLEIRKVGEKDRHQYLVRVLFEPTYQKDSDFLYEADLITDQRKDYEPTINRGKHRFAATWATIRIDWYSDEIQQWRSDIERLSRSPETLAGWVEAGLDMFVICSPGSRCGRVSILTNSDLERHVAAKVSLEDLKARLTCSECGKRQVRVLVF